MNFTFFSCFTLLTVVGIWLFLSVELATGSNLVKGKTAKKPAEPKCAKWVEWPYGGCPKGDRWQCWSSSFKRLGICRARKWKEHSQLPNRKGKGNCYCCGSCHIIAHAI